MEETIFKALGEKEQPKEVRQILEDTKQLIKMSRDKMGQYYDSWDHAHETYKNDRNEDVEDRKAKERGEPKKMVVPTTKAQIDTFVAFCLALYNQNERFFPIEEFTAADHAAARAAEAVLERDLQYNGWYTKCWQFILDTAKFGLGVGKVCWLNKTRRMKVMKETPAPSFMGFTLGSPTVEEVEEDVVEYQGNEILNISPYRFFPDTRLPLSRFQEGEFVGSEDTYSYVSLKQMEKDGTVVGIDHLRPMTKEALRNRKGSRFHDLDIQPDAEFRGAGQSKGTYILTEVQRTLIPSEYKIDGVPLGPETWPVKYLIQYVNDDRIVRMERLEYAHNEYTYFIAQLSPDLHETINEGLAGNIDQLQSVISWFINSRITSVRKIIDNRMIVDPAGVQLQDIVERKPIIRMRPDASRQGVDKFLKQLDVQDVTSNHLADVKFLQEMIQHTTGINDAALGQFYTGRRSATEARNVNTGSYQRLKMVAQLIHISGIQKMGKQMLSNLREGLDAETFVKIMQDDAIEAVEFIQVDKRSLSGNYDFEMLDITTPSERQFIAQAIEQVLAGFLSAPEAAIALQMDPRAMLLEAMTLRGVRNPKRFTLRNLPQMQGQPNGQPNGAPTGEADPTGGVAGQPDLGGLVDPSAPTA